MTMNDVMIAIALIAVASDADVDLFELEYEFFNILRPKLIPNATQRQTIVTRYVMLIFLILPQVVIDKFSQYTSVGSDARST